MGHVFISYSHQDGDYAHALADSLQGMGFPVWIDARIDYGSQWPLEVQKQLDACDAFILIMSPRSFNSEWVQSELQRAKRKAKPVFPLMLEGNEPWLSVESTQYYDVRNHQLPDDDFYADLEQAAASKKAIQTALKIPTYNKKAKQFPWIWLVALAGIAAVCIGLFAVSFQLLTDRKLFSPVPTEPAVIPSRSTPLENIASPAADTMTGVVTLPVELPEGSEVTMIAPLGDQVRYTILSAWREPSSPGKQLLRLRIRVWTDFIGGVNFWSDSFRLAAEDLRLAPVNDLNLIARRDETVDGDVEFEIDSSLKEAVLVINVGRIPDAWATRELRLVFP